jgi:hypothetical protein
MMHATGKRIGDAVFWLLLSSLGVMMAIASRYSKRFRRQVTRDLVVGMRTEDGIGRQYRFNAQRRTMDVLWDRTEEIDCELIVSSGWIGFRSLLSTHAVGRMVEGMNDRRLRIEGNAVVMLWFHGLTRIVAPIGRTRRPRKPIPVPLRGPERDAPWARRIVREPSVGELSREWPEAWAAREKLLQLRAPAGEPLPPG